MTRYVIPYFCSFLNCSHSLIRILLMMVIMVNIRISPKINSLFLLFFKHESTSPNLSASYRCSFFFSRSWLDAQSCSTLCNPMNCMSPSRFLYPWNFPARTSEWVDISYSKGSFQRRNQPLCLDVVASSPNSLKLVWTKEKKDTIRVNPWFICFKPR